MGPATKVHRRSARPSLPRGNPPIPQHADACQPTRDTGARPRRSLQRSAGRRQQPPHRLARPPCGGGWSAGSRDIRVCCPSGSLPPGPPLAGITSSRWRKAGRTTTPARARRPASGSARAPRRWAWAARSARKGCASEYGGVFEPLRDPAFFRQLRADAEAGTIVWPNEADIARTHPARTSREHSCHVSPMNATRPRLQTVHLGDTPWQKKPAHLQVVSVKPATPAVAEIG